jgi:hypothetical protein
MWAARWSRVAPVLSVVETARVGAVELQRVREIALGLPAVTERRTHGAVGFFVQHRRPLCYVHDNHRGDGRVSLWFPSSALIQDELTTAEPQRFFRPMPSSSGVFSTWVAMFLDLPGDQGVDWPEVSAVLHETYRHIAPMRLVAELDLESPPPTARPAAESSAPRRATSGSPRASHRSSPLIGTIDLRVQVPEDM